MKFTGTEVSDTQNEQVGGGGGWGDVALAQP